MPAEKLSWQNRFVKQLVQNLETYSEADCESKTPQVISGEDNLILLRVSLTEWEQLYSSVYSGADFCYPDISDQVRWILNRAVECPVPICELIIDCITNDVDTQQAIVDMLMSNDTFNDYLETKIDTLTTGQITGKLISGECDESIVAGKIKALVDAMNQANIDWFEKIEVGTNDEEKFALAIEAIPILGELPFDQVIEFGEDILEDFAEVYAGQVDAELLQEWYCGLWCIAMGNPDCSITYGEIYDYFVQRTTSGLNPFSALGDVIGFIRTGDFAGGTKVADGTMMLQVGLMVNGREFMGSSLPTISFATRDAPPASYWEECDVCPEDDLWLSNIGLPEDSLVLDSQDDDTQTWTMKNYYTGNYLTGGALSSNGNAFYILDVDFTPAATGPDARFVLASGTYTLDTVPCFLPTTKIWIYNALADSEVTVTIARLGCREIWVVGRTDGGFVGVVTTCVFVGSTATGGSIYDVTSDATTGPMGIGVNTVEEDLTTLKSAYLVSAVSMTPGSTISYHYHEQAESIGDGTGASGTVSSKKWSFFGLSTYGQTVRLTFEANPY